MGKEGYSNGALDNVGNKEVVCYTQSGDGQERNFWSCLLEWSEEADGGGIRMEMVGKVPILRAGT